ncbi:MAG: type IV secretory system conjugative DNA transfer family protein [Gammaproteobacteria bacterium]|nr:type IV secretory system conjugative DNA transfer family protein [Gammaproteobacteria bacterium]
MPSMKFTSAGKYKYGRNKFFLGVSSLLRRSVGVKLRRHGIIISSSGGGKGACLLSQNLFRWKHNALTIDPKGELSELTAVYRQKKFKQNSYVIDPFKEAKKLPDEFRVSYNPLSDIDINAPNIVEDINVISDGLIMRHEPRHAMWDNHAHNIISGVIALVKCDAPPELQTLSEVRKVIRTSDLQHMAKTHMQDDTRCGGTIQTAAKSILCAKGDEYISNAEENTRWLDSDPMVTTHGTASFSLSDLKEKKTSVYLVLPPNYLKQHGRFLRVFVRCAIDQMSRRTKDGKEKGRECLFLLDEMPACGTIDEISTSYGLLRSRGLHLISVLQNYGQFLSLYGKDGTANFFSGADFQSYFGVDDIDTLEYLSNLIGTRESAGLFGVDKEFVGRRLMTPQEIRKHIAVREKDDVARRMIVIARGDDVLSLRPKPYFKDRRFKKYG